MRVKSVTLVKNHSEFVATHCWQFLWGKGFPKKIRWPQRLKTGPELRWLPVSGGPSRTLLNVLSEGDKMKGNQLVMSWRLQRWHLKRNIFTSLKICLKHLETSRNLPCFSDKSGLRLHLFGSRLSHFRRIIACLGRTKLSVITWIVGVIQSKGSMFDIFALDDRLWPSAL